MDNYNTILTGMKNKYKELTGREVPPLSDIDIRMKVLAGEIYQNEVNLDFVRRQISPLTAAGEYLDSHAYERGIERLEAVKAKGTVKFYTNTPAQSNITIPAGSVVSTGGSDGVRYVTETEKVLLSGATEISVPCVAVNGGASGNAAVGEIDTLVTNIVGIDRVSNIYAMSGGTDRETDEKLRRRILDSHKYIPNGTNAVFYKDLALSVEGVTSANVLPQARGKGTIDVYVASGRAPAGYEIVNKVTELINKERELNTSVMVFSATAVNFTVGVEVELKDGYSLDVVTQNITDSINEMLNSLEIGESVYENHLSAAIISAEGVSNFYWVGGYRNRCTVDPDEFPVLQSVHVVLEDE